jgi:hypothetical protein
MINFTIDLCHYLVYIPFQLTFMIPFYYRSISQIVNWLPSLTSEYVKMMCTDLFVVLPAFCVCHVTLTRAWYDMLGRRHKNHSTPRTRAGLAIVK